MTPKEELEKLKRFFLYEKALESWHSNRVFQFWWNVSASGNLSTAFLNKYFDKLYFLRVNNNQRIPEEVILKNIDKVKKFDKKLIGYIIEENNYSKETETFLKMLAA